MPACLHFIYVYILEIFLLTYYKFQNYSELEIKQNITSEKHASESFWHEQKPLEPNMGSSPPQDRAETIPSHCSFLHKPWMPTRSKVKGYLERKYDFR